jgi:hypothetical protein
MALCKEGCGRVARSRGWCSSHYRMWLARKPLDGPIRGYQRYEEGPDGKVVAVPSGPLVRRLPSASPVACPNFCVLSRPPVSP